GSLLFIHNAGLDRPDHYKVLFEILSRTVADKMTMALLRNILKSFPKGIPLGNLTSQLFANVCLNELDQFVKHELRSHSYLRYCDDFVLLNQDRKVLESALPCIQTFLSVQLRLVLHPDKIILDRYHHGIDFLGFVCFPHHRILRTKTKRRMLKRINTNNLTSYPGLLKRCRSCGVGGI
ncbi:MAG: reverse transcriptase domain-containing protein, partial [Patescibacteria group bacterium]